MKYNIYPSVFFILVNSIFVNSCSNSTNYKVYKESQDYQVPIWNDRTENKSALFVFPHPDDEITCGGTIDQLKKSGWKINLVTLSAGQLSEKEERKAEWQKSSAALGFNNYDINDLKNNTWEDVLTNHIDFWYDHLDSIENMVYHSILKYQPSVVFTYDTALGGYGNPEHRVSAATVYNVFNKHKNDSLFPVQMIL